MARRVSVEIVGDSASVERAFARTSASAKSFDRTLGSSIRGATAGAGVFRSLGRSLAFASGGFLAFAGVSDIIRGSIQQADSLEKAQRGLSAAIQHTGGNLAKLKPQYEATAEAAAKFGVNQADATTGLERATLLAGGAVKAQHAYQEALVISKATGKDFNTVLTATAKGQEGVTTSLQRYGIEIKKGTPGQEQFNIVMGRFAGQAKANTSAIDRFNATWQNTEIILGTALLPVLDKLLTKFSNWLTKMQKSGRLQRDINSAVQDGASVFHGLESVVKTVDKVTGSFLHTLELLAAFKFAKLIGGWAGDLSILIARWRGVTAAAETAEGAEAAAAAGGAGAAAAGAAGLGLGALAAPATIIGVGALALATSKSKSWDLGNGARLFQDSSGHFFLSRGGRSIGISQQQALQLLKRAGIVSNGAAQVPAPGSDSPNRGGLAPPPIQAPNQTPRRDPRHPFHTTVPTTLQIQLAQAQLSGNQQAQLAALDKERVLLERELAIAEKDRKKKEVLAALQALQAVQSQIDSINSSIEAAKQQKQQAEAAKKAAARAKELAKEQARKQFNVPLALEVADAKAQALGKDERPILLKLKRAAERALKSGRLGLQGQIDAWNEIASVNQQLSSSTTDALGGFKQASTKALTANLGLTNAQRKALRARLSQLGPHGTVPSQGVGAYGYRIGSDDRPIEIHTHVKLRERELGNSVTRLRQRRNRRNPTQRRGPNAATQ